jgi:hypothetical protein
MDERAKDPADVAMDGRYANDFRIGHTAHEFVLDFAQSYEGHVSPAPHTRIITGPPYARQLLDLLAHSIREYERIFGPLPTAGAPAVEP